MLPSIDVGHLHTYVCFTGMCYAIVRMLNDLFITDA